MIHRSLVLELRQHFTPKGLEWVIIIEATTQRVGLIDAQLCCEHAQVILLRDIKHRGILHQRLQVLRVLLLRSFTLFFQRETRLFERKLYGPLDRAFGDPRSFKHAKDPNISLLLMAGGALFLCETSLGVFCDNDGLILVNSLSVDLLLDKS